MTLEDAHYSEWDDIPDELRTWILSQDGLKINGVSVNSTESLGKTHRLLCQGNKPTKKSIQTHGTLAIALDIAVRYFLHIEGVRFRQSSIDDLVTYGAPPRNLVPRVCGLCKQEVLDDAFARYKKLDPKKYVLRLMRGGCGLPGCPQSTENVWAIPAESGLEAVHGARTRLQMRPQTSPWERYFIRSTSEVIKSLPTAVAILCSKCRQQTWIDHNPRWTTETTPRYVPRSPRCQTCVSKISYWIPVAEIPWIGVPKLSRKWRSLTNNRAFDASKVAEDPDSYFP